MQQQTEAKNAIKRTADPRIYAANVRQSVTQQQYAMDDTKFSQCMKMEDVQWDLIDQPVGGMHCAAKDVAGGMNAAVEAAIVDAWFPTGPGNPDLRKDIDATYARILKQR